MKHSKGAAIVVTTASAVALVLTGCTGGGTSSGKTTIDFSYWGGAEDNKAVSSAVAGFEKANPDITVKKIWIQGDVEQKNASLIAGGAPPTVMMVSNGSLPGYAPAYQKVSVDPATFVSPIISDYMKYKSAYYATPWIAKPKAMAINVDMFKKAGVSIPSATQPMTPDEFQAIAMKLTGGSGATKTYGSAGLWWDNWLSGFGGSWYNSDATACRIDSKASVEASDFVVNSIRSNYAITPKQLGGDDPIALFSQDKIAMLPDTGPFNLPALKEGKEAWTLVPVPGAGAELEVDGLALTAKATGAQADAGKKFIQYMTQSAAGQKAVTSGSAGFGVPVIKAAIPTFLAAGSASQNLQALVDSLDRIVPRVGVKNDQPIRNAIRNKLFAQTGLGTGTQAPAKVLPELNKECTTQLQTLGK